MCGFKQGDSHRWVARAANAHDGARLPDLVSKANTRRSKIRAHVEHVFAGQNHRMGLVVRTIGIARATIKIGIANLVYNFQRLAWLEGRTAPA